MTVFEQDVRQKRDVARGASRRKGGAGSRRCTLPSDYLTAAQKEKRNGPVTVVKLNEPMKWERYDMLPDHLRREYLLHLIRGYTVGGEMLGRMLGIGEEQMRTEAERLNVTLPDAGRCFGSRERWERFCTGAGEKADGGAEESFDGFPDAAQLNRLYERYRGNRVRVHLRVEVMEDE